MGVVMEMNALELGASSESDFVEMERFGKRRPGKIDITQELRSCEIDYAGELGFPEVGLSHEPNILETGFLCKLHVPKIRVFENVSIKAGAECRLAHRGP
jgi:hypothetical protein